MKKDKLRGSTSSAINGDDLNLSVSTPSAVRRPPATELPSAVRGSPTTYPSPSAVRAPIAKVRWRCRRGMRELDVLLERYVEQRYACASAVEQQAFESLLDLPDPQLFAYLVRREPPADSGWVDVITKLTAADP